MATLRRIDPLGGDPVDLDLWRQSWRLWNAGTRRTYGPEANQVDADTLLEQRRRSGDPFVHVVATERDVVVGRLDLVTNPRDEKGLVHCLFEVMPPWRGQGLGQQLWDEADKYLPDLGATALAAQSIERIEGGGQDGAATYLLTRAGFHPVQTLITSEVRLDEPLPEVPLADGYSIRIVEGMPPADLMPRLAEMHHALEHDEPRAGRKAPSAWTTERLTASHERAAAVGIRQVTALLVEDATGEIVGFSSNSWTPKNPAAVHQGGTWTAAGHRNKGLATAARRAAVVAMADIADGATVNRASHDSRNVTTTSLNETLGYVPTHRRVQWRRDLDA